MNKIGIITIPRADNYGSVLQAYAMQKFIDTIDINNEIIDYVSPFLVGRYPIWAIRSDNIIVLLKSIFQNLMTYKYKKSKKEQFKSFRELMRFSSKTVYSSNEIEKYEVIVSGSDQIWNTRITKGDTAFFIDFADYNTKKISFATSMGYSDRNKEEIEFYKREIARIDYIGVRETQDVQFINKLFPDKFGNTTYIIDPTLLVDKEIWDELCTKKLIKRNYILIYSFGRDALITQEAKRLSKEYSLPVYVICDEWRKKNSDGFYNCQGIGPVDFISLIANASYVLTNSFHGTVFSIIFKKKFVTVPYKGTENRMLSLLKLLKLESQILKKDKINDYNIDYFMTMEIIQNEKDKARDFLIKALS